MMIQEFLSDADGYCDLKINDESDDCLFVVFGSYGLRKGVFDFYASLRTLRKNVLFVNCPSNDWYTSPLPFCKTGGLEESIEKLSRLVNLICAQYSFSKTTYMGFSMGGYGALLYSRSSAIEVPLSCIVLGTNIYLEMPKTVSLLHYKASWPSRHVHDLRELAFPTENRRYLFVFGEFDVGDACSALMFREKFFGVGRFFSHIGSTHNIPAHMKRGVGLIYGLERLISFDLDIPGRGDFVNRFSVEDIEPLLYFSPGIVNSVEIEYLRRCLNLYPSFGLALLRIGAFDLAKGDTNSALTMLKRAWEIAPQIEEVNRLLSLAYERTGRQDMALSHAILANSIYETSGNFGRVTNLLAAMNN